jgi:hypothetical protein
MSHFATFFTIISPRHAMTPDGFDAMPADIFRLRHFRQAYAICYAMMLLRHAMRVQNARRVTRDATRGHSYAAPKRGCMRVAVAAQRRAAARCATACDAEERSTRGAHYARRRRAALCLYAPRIAR